MNIKIMELMKSSFKKIKFKLLYSLIKDYEREKCLH